MLTLPDDSLLRITMYKSLVEVQLVARLPNYYDVVGSIPGAINTFSLPGLLGVIIQK